MTHAQFDMTRWREHARAMVEDWLCNEFTWAGAALAQWVTSVQVRIGDAEPTTMWSRPNDIEPSPADVPILISQQRPRAALKAAVGDMWNPLWESAIESWALSGTWLHPETRWQIDQKTLAENTASLMIGCLDRTDPSRPRRYDPAVDPATHDIGVITFPINTFRLLDYLDAGYPIESATVMVAADAVTDACIHESLELFQNHVGVPVLDPHTVAVVTTLTWNPPTANEHSLHERTL